ncbi:MAG: hypothetical protein AB1631_16645 [Acidobacteriota bacterium]
MTERFGIIARIAAMIAGALLIVGAFFVDRLFGVQSEFIEIGARLLTIAIAIIVVWELRRKRKAR